MSDDVRSEVERSARRAAAAGSVLRTQPDAAISDALEGAAARLDAARDDVLDVNADEVARAEQGGMSPGLLDRLRLTPDRLREAAGQLREIAALDVPPALREIRTLPGGLTVYERRVPVGTIAASYEARPAVTLDVAGQVLRARSAALLRTGSAALATSAVLVDRVLGPALDAAGLPADAVQLVRSPGHAGAEALLAFPDLLPLVIVRGSGDTTRHLAALGAANGVRVLSHADGGGVLYADASADVEVLRELVRAGVDRLGVCNRLNLLLVHRTRWDELLGVVEGELAALGVALDRPPHAHPLGHEWALDAEHEATVTVEPVDGPVAAAELAAAETSGIAATVCAADAGAAGAFLGAWNGTGGFWNATTRLLDGYKLLGVPETGINVDRLPGPRGPVSFQDLALRQYVVLPAGAPVPELA